MLAFILILNEFAVCILTAAFAEGDPVDKGSTCFYYTGTANSVGILRFSVAYAASTETSATSGNLSGFGVTSTITTRNGFEAVMLTGCTNKLSSVLISFGFSSQLGSVPVAFNGGTVEIEDAAVNGADTFVMLARRS